MGFNCTCICNNDIKEKPYHHNREESNCDVISAFPVQEHEIIESELITKCLFCDINIVEHDISFVKTKCGHTMCFKCFINSSKIVGDVYCPVCKTTIYETKIPKRESQYKLKNIDIIEDIERSLKSMNNTINSM